MPTGLLSSPSVAYDRSLQPPPPPPPPRPQPYGTYIYMRVPFLRRRYSCWLEKGLHPRVQFHLQGESQLWIPAKYVGHRNTYASGWSSRDPACWESGLKRVLAGELSVSHPAWSRGSSCSTALYGCTWPMTFMRISGASLPKRFPYLFPGPNIATGAIIRLELDILAQGLCTNRAGAPGDGPPPGAGPGSPGGISLPHAEYNDSSGSIGRPVQFAEQ